MREFFFIEKRSSLTLKSDKILSCGSVWAKTTVRLSISGEGKEGLRKCTYLPHFLFPTKIIWLRSHYIEFSFKRNLVHRREKCCVTWRHFQLNLPKKKRLFCFWNCFVRYNLDECPFVSSNNHSHNQILWIIFVSICFQWWDYVWVKIHTKQIPIYSFWKAIWSESIKQDTYSSMVIISYEKLVIIFLEKLFRNSDHESVQ